MAELAEIAISNNPGALYINGRKIMQLGIMYFTDSRTELETAFNNKSNPFSTGDTINKLQLLVQLFLVNYNSSVCTD